MKFLYIFVSHLWKFSGRSDELTDEDYDGTYYDETTSENVEPSPSNLSLLTTMSEGTNEQTVDEDDEDVSSTPIMLSTVPTTILETAKSIETTTGKIYDQSG